MDQPEQEQLTKLTATVRDLSDRVGGLETRADGIESRLGLLAQDLAVIKSNHATRADVLEAKNSITMWVVSALLFAQLIPILFRIWTG